MTIETIGFDKGINRRKSPLYLAENEFYSCEGLSLDEIGVLKCRKPKTLVTTPDHPYTGSDLTNIHGIHRYNDYLVAVAKEYCPGGSDGAYFNYLLNKFAVIDVLNLI